jgi:hypothetical protein
MVFEAGMIVLTNVWDRRHDWLALDPVKEMEDVYRCAYVLKQSEIRWPAAGRFWYVLCSQLPLFTEVAVKGIYCLDSLLLLNRR